MDHIIDLQRLVNDALDNLKLYRQQLSPIDVPLSAQQFVENLKRAAEIEYTVIRPQPNLHFEGWDNVCALPSGQLPDGGPRILELYAVVKEALRNAIKHSHATDITISISNNTTEIEMTIQDNGAGFNATHAPSETSGLAIMRRRITGLGGAMSIETKMSSGTRVVCRCPLDIGGE